MHYLLLLAQQVPGPSDWWLERGVLGAFAIFVLGCLLAGVKAVWSVMRPYWVEKNQLALDKEKNLNAWIKQTSDTEVERLESSRAMSAALTQISNRQAGHDGICQTTHKLAAEIQRDVEEIKQRLPKLSTQN
jgi:hypothetical protein